MTMSSEKQFSTKAGTVTSDARDKTIKVELGYRVRHRRYGKYIRRRTVLHVHDERNEAKLGDQVEIALGRPISKTKSWRLVRVLVHEGETAAAEDAVAVTEDGVASTEDAGAATMPAEPTAVGETAAE